MHCPGAEEGFVEVVGLVCSYFWQRATPTAGFEARAAEQPLSHVFATTEVAPMTRAESPIDLTSILMIC